MAFERLQKSNEKHQCVIVKTNKLFFFWEQQKQMFQAATEKAAGQSSAGWRWVARGGLLLLPVGACLLLMSWKYWLSLIYIFVCVLNIKTECKARPHMTPCMKDKRNTLYAGIVDQ